MKGSTVAVIDIGSTKVSCCIVDIHNDMDFSIVGVGCCMCVGIRDGNVLDMDYLCKSISKAVESAEKVAKFRIKEAYISVSGKNVRSKVEDFTIDIKSGIITKKDIAYIKAAYGIESDSIEIVHFIPVIYRLDNGETVKNPIGKRSKTLSISANVISMPKIQLNNILICMDRCHLDVSGVVASCYASGLALMDAHDYETNVVVIDIGGAMSVISFFFNGVLCGSEVCDIGGRLITSDIAYGLNMPMASAERIKTLHGAAIISFEDLEDRVYVPVVDSGDAISLRQITKRTLNEIIQPRAEEILLSIRRKIMNSTFSDALKGGIILTGGCSSLTGLKDLAREVFKCDVRIKKIDDISHSSCFVLDNDHSVVVGMIRFAQWSDYLFENENNVEKKSNGSGIIKKIINWIEKKL